MWHCITMFWIVFAWATTMVVGQRLDAEHFLEDLSKEHDVIPRLNNGAIFKRKATYKESEFTFLSGLILRAPSLPQLDNLHLHLDCTKVPKQEFGYGFKKEICNMYKLPMEELNEVLKIKSLALTNLIDGIKLTNPTLFGKEKGTDPTRNKRNIFGSIFSDLFGLATKNNVRNLGNLVSKHINDLDSGLEASKHVMSSMASAFSVTQDNLERLNDQLFNNSMKIFENAENIHKIRWKVHREIQLSMLNSYSLRFAANLSAHVYGQGLRLEASISELIHTWTTYQTGLMAADKGRLHQGLISAKDFNQFLDDVSEYIIHNFQGYRLRRRPLSFYYNEAKLYPFMGLKNDVYVLELEIEKEDNRNFVIYEVNHFAQAIQNSEIGENDHGFTKFLGLPDMFAISEHKYTFELSFQTYYSSCHPLGVTDEVKCDQKFIILDSETDNCVKSIYLDDQEKVLKNCISHILPPSENVPATVMDLNGGKVLLTNLKENTMIKSCSTGHEVINVYHTMVVTLECACELLGNSVFISQNTFRCERFSNLGSNLTLYPSNRLAAAALTVDNFDWKTLNWEEETKPVNLTIPRLSKPIKLILKDNKIPLNLNEISKKVKSGKPMISEDDLDEALDDNGPSTLLIIFLIILSCLGLICVGTLALGIYNSRNNRALFRSVGQAPAAIAGAAAAAALPAAEGTPINHNLSKMNFESWNLALEIALYLTVIYGLY